MSWFIKVGLCLSCREKTSLLRHLDSNRCEQGLCGLIIHALDFLFCGQFGRDHSADKEDVNSERDISREPSEDKHFTSSIIRQPDADGEYIN